jgi:flavin-binding protein dodecin
VKHANVRQFGVRKGEAEGTAFFVDVEAMRRAEDGAPGEGAGASPMGQGSVEIVRESPLAWNRAAVELLDEASQILNEEVAVNVSEFGVKVKDDRIASYLIRATIHSAKPLPEEKRQLLRARLDCPDDEGECSGLQKIEVMAENPVAWREATDETIETALFCLRGMRRATIKKFDVKIEDGKIVAYIVHVEIYFDAVGMGRPAEKPPTALISFNAKPDAPTSAGGDGAEQGTESDEPQADETERQRKALISLIRHITRKICMTDLAGEYRLIDIGYKGEVIVVTLARNGERRHAFFVFLARTRSVRAAEDAVVLRNYLMRVVASRNTTIDVDKMSAIFRAWFNKLPLSERVA